MMSPSKEKQGNRKSHRFLLMVLQFFKSFLISNLFLKLRIDLFNLSNF